MHFVRMWFLLERTAFYCRILAEQQVQQHTSLEWKKKGDIHEEVKKQNKTKRQKQLESNNCSSDTSEFNVSLMLFMTLWVDFA